MEAYKHPLVERKILALLLRSKTASIRILPRLRKELFSVKDYRVLFPVIEQHWNQYQTYPKKSACMTGLKASGVKERDLEKYELVIDKLYSTDIDKSDDKFYVDRVTEAWKARKLLKLIENSMDMVEQGKIKNSIEHIQTEIAKLQYRAGNNVVQEGDYLESFSERLKLIKDRQENPEKYRGVPTGIKQFDDYYGGLMNSELGVIVGGTGKGKSIALMNFATAAWLKGHDVMIFTIEMSKKEYEFRIDSRLAGIMHRKFRTGEVDAEELSKWKDKIDRLRGKHDNKLFTVDTPEGCTTDFIEFSLMKHRDQFKKKPLVLVDYLNIMHSKNASRYEADHEQQGKIARELKMLARAWDLPLWTAAQPNRGGQKKRSMDVEDIGRSIGIIENANIVLGLTQTKDEELNGTMKLQNIKGRDGKMPEVTLHPDLSRMRLNIAWSKDDEKEEKRKKD